MRNCLTLLIVTFCLSLAAIRPSLAIESKASARQSAVQKGSESKETGTASLIDLNLASKEKLLTLPGLTEQEVDKIIAGRPFTMKTQLRKNGILPDDKFYQIVDKVTIDLVARRDLKKQEESADYKKKKDAFSKRMKSVKFVKTASGLRYSDLKKGTGPAATDFSLVTMHYTGWLEDGTKFDSSADRGKPFIFRLSKGEVIAGWDEGIKSMRVHGKRRLVIPGKLGYGESGYPPKIPPNATLIFDVELLDVKSD